MRGRRTILGVGLAVTAFWFAACGGGSTTVTQSSSTTSTTAATTTTTLVPTTTSTAPIAATDSMAPFFGAAERIDAALKAAAKRVNGGITNDRMAFDAATRKAVDGADPRGIELLIPAGLDPAVSRAAFTVYGDLVFRYAALQPVSMQSTTVPHGDEYDYVLRCLGNGATPAQRFGADLSAARAAAAAARPPTEVAPDSRAAAEVAIRGRFYELAAMGCANCGAGGPPAYPAVHWGTTVGQDWPIPPDGTVGDGVNFTAKYVAGAGWKVELLAC